MRKRKVVTVLRDSVDGSLAVLAGGERQGMDEFLETHIPLQVGGFAPDGDQLVALMLVEETEPERTGSLGF